MKKPILEHRIPTLLGLLLLVIGVGATSYLTSVGINLFGQASAPETPENIRITDVSDTSFTVSYKTATSVAGSLTYGKTETFGSIAVDNRDQQQEILSPHAIHYITVRTLTPETTYFFAIVSGETTFLDKNDKPFTVTTGPAIKGKPSTTLPASGKIILSTSGTLDEAVIYLSGKETQTISALVKPDGSYILPLNTTKTKNLNAYASFTDNQEFTGLVIASTTQTSFTLLVNQTNPIPTLILGQNYDFTLNTDPLKNDDTNLTATLSAQLRFPSFEASTNTRAPQITTPKEDEAFTDDKPLFKGVASPGASIKIEIHSLENIQEQIKVDTRGNWSYRPTKALSPGEHTISITAPDQFGIFKTITQNFTVYASGSQVNESATPSAQPTLRPTVTTAVSPSPTLIPSPSVSSATPLPTIQVPTPTLILMVSPTGLPTKSELLATGNTSILMIGLLGIGTLVSGILIFFLGREKIKH